MTSQDITAAKLLDMKRRIEMELSDAGFSDQFVETKLDGEGKVIVMMTIDGRTADGLPEHFIDAIDDAKNNGIPLTGAFDARNMYGEAI